MRGIRRWSLRLLAVPVAALLAGVAAPAAGRDSRVEPGVSIAGLPVGGFGSEETRALVRRALDAPLEFRLGNRRWTAKPAQLGASAAVDAAVARALHARPGTAVRVSVSAASVGLNRYVTHLDRTLSYDARDARLLGLDSELRPLISTEATGRKLVRRPLRDAIVAQLPRAIREPITPTFRVVRPDVTRATFGPVVVIRRESKTLTLYNASTPIQTLGVAVGTARYPTPLGTFAIVDMQYDPWWYPPDSDWAKGLKPVPPGPGNPLGTRWMGISAPGVGMHGTPDAASIGYSASHGCIRLRIPDAEWLFQQVRVGTPVVIVSA